MRVMLIHNPTAGENEQPTVDELLELTRAAGHDVTCESSRGDDWEYALDDRTDLVAVAGGDGTVGAVACRLAGRRVPLAVLPVGTANNIARILGLADKPLERLVAGWASARRIGFDVGVVHGPWAATRFIEGVGVGLLARAIFELDARDDIAFTRPDNREGKMTSGLRRLLDLVGNCPAKELQITLDGEDLSGEYILLEVMNIQHIGPSLHLAPEANPSDGLLDVVLLTDPERDKLGEYFANRLEGDSHPLRWNVHRGRHLQIVCEDCDMHIDDKVLPARGSTLSQSPAVLDVQVEGHALEFLV
jgi:diacylglycerol kinase (ATP)